MSLHACNYLCSLHPAMHDAQKDLLPLQGGHSETDREELLAALKKRVVSDQEMIAILEED